MKANRMWGHMELAMLYFPYILPKSASTRLGVLISLDPELLADMLKAGYRKGQHILTPRQVNIIIDHLGEPENWNIN